MQIFIVFKSVFKKHFGIAAEAAIPFYAIRPLLSKRTGRDACPTECP